MRALALLVALLAGGSVSDRAPVSRSLAPQSLEAVAFMLGCWRGPLGGGEGNFVEERYGPSEGGLILGTVKYVRAGRPTQHEFIEIRAGEEGLTFLPYPGGRRSEHVFRATSSDGARVVFEAPEHDFPKRIVYTAVGLDGLEGSADAGPDDPSPRRWPMRRIACDAGTTGVDDSASYTGR